MNITELSLLTSDLPGTKAFYEHVLGFKLIRETPFAISFATGSSVLSFECCDQQVNPCYHFAFNIPCNQLETALSLLADRLQFIACDDSFVTDFRNWNAKAIYFFDNNRNIVELIARADLLNPSDSAFTIDSVLCISEIGLVADEPLKAAAELIGKTQLSYFSKGPKREDFVAVGCNTCLFVISSPGRKWYPTESLAEKWKIRAVIETAAVCCYLEF